MRRIAALYDVHGNLPALEAVLSEVESAEVDLVVFGGDVAAGPMPRETLEKLLALEQPARFVMGNGDRQLLRIWDEQALGEDPLEEPDEWTWLQLDREHRDMLAAFEPLVRAEVDGLGEVLFRHGSPGSEDEMVTAGMPDDVLEEMLAGVDADVVVIGHAHTQFDRRTDRGRVVSPGSVGMPYREPGAYWALLGPEVELRRADYDRDEAAQRIQRSGWPRAEEFVRDNLLAVPAAPAAGEHLERTAGRD